MIKVDLVSDIGEGFGRYKLCNEEAIIPLLTSVNIACGFHAGDPNVMRNTVRICKENNIGIGAHPGFPDLMGFGRRFMKIKDEELENYLYYQIGALEAFAKLYGEKIQHCIAHGAWGNWLEQDIENARKFVKAVANYSKDIIILAISGGYRIQTAKELKLRVANEFFADREVQNNGQLVPRSISGSVLHDENKIVKRVGENMIFQNVGLILVVIIVLIVVVILIMLGINGILFKLALRLVKAERTDFINVYITSLICALLGWIPCVGCIFCWVVINARHNIGLVKAILVWILKKKKNFI